MAATTLTADLRDRSHSVAYLFVGCALGIVAIACLLAGWTPITFSIVTVFLFAGPHNWFEARYFMTRMPPRWGKLWKYFALGLGGVPVLAATIIALPLISNALGGTNETWLTCLAAWNTALIVWVATLAHIRSQQNPTRNWPWLWPVALLLVAAAWSTPYQLSIALVYLHPLLALAFLDVEIGRRWPQYLLHYRLCLLAIPAALCLLAWRLAGAPNLPGDDLLTLQITHHAGANLFSGVSTHFLVAAHTFLEMLHYGVWCFALPVLAIGRSPWKLKNIPIAGKSTVWKAVVASVLVTGIAIVALLWIGFSVDYPLTRNVYFTIAIMHVLAEFPFLLRML